MDGQNYLIPVDAKIQSKADITTQTVDLQNLLNAVSDSNVDMKVIVIDACRDNPFEAIASAKERGDVQVASIEADSGLRSISSGLSQIIAPPGSLVAFATAPGTAALDGEGRNSPYAEALVNVISEPDLRVEDVFIAVRNRVSAATSGKQVPWETSSLTSVAAFTGKAKTVPETTGIFEELPTTSVWDDTYFAEMRCTSHPSDRRYSRPLLKHYFPTITSGIGRSTQKSTITEEIDYKIFTDGSVSITGTGSRGGDTWLIKFQGKMRNGEALMSGFLGDRGCEFNFLRKNSKNYPLNGMKKLNDQEIVELLKGSSFVSQLWSTYRPNEFESILYVSEGDAADVKVYKGSWRAKNGQTCQTFPLEFRKEEKCWDIFSKTEDGKIKAAVIDQAIGRGWVVDVVQGRSTPQL